ncbi:MAG: STAS/SEC14 domain-containing protein [Saprospiraceae bacterium]|nr:MAG: STAS/SEC14 domain-containing protein [Saprospiraceae bacterium]
MQTIEIRKGLSIGVDEMVDGASKMETSSLEQFVAKLENLLANRKVKNPSRRERELLAKINQKLPELTQSRYDFLTAKLQDETITAKEHKELLKLIEISEQHNAEWLEALAGLSQLRGVHFEELMRQLGIPPQHSKA